MSRTPLVKYLITHQSTLINIDFLKEIWMIPERATAIEKVDMVFTLSSYSNMYPGKLFVYDNMFYAVISFERIDDRSSDIRTYRINGEETGIVYDPKENRPLCTPQDSFTLEAKEIQNYPDGPVLETTIGRFISNAVFLVYPFKDVIPYLNEEFSVNKLEKRIAGPLLDGRISVRDVKDKYINAMFLLGTATEMFCPNISEKTITVPDEIIKLRKHLVDSNRAALEAGDASVMSDIEQQLIKAYKAYLQNDPSLHFLLKSKYFNVTLKKLFLSQGMTETFGTPGKFTFIEQPMGEGWRKENLPEIFNEVRAGSYARGIETQNGGVIAKLILRILQDTRLTIPDCGTTHGEPVNMNKEQLLDFMWNYVITKQGDTVLIDPESIDRFVDKDIVVRTPGYCQSPQGFCAKCFGNLFEKLEQSAFAPVANDFARAQTTAALKAMHGKSHTVVQIDDLNKYLAKTL